MKNYPIEMKDGYLCELRNGNLVGVYHWNNDTLCLSGEEDWFPLTEFDEDFEMIGVGFARKYDIVKVWGRTYPRGCSRLEVDDRELLWEREDWEGDSSKDDDDDYANKTIEELKKEVDEELKKFPKEVRGPLMMMASMAALADILGDKEDK